MVKQNVPYPSLGTPSVLLNLDKLESNITHMQNAANEAGVKLKPHIKIHQCVEIAKMQIQAGGFRSPESQRYGSRDETAA